MYAKLLGIGAAYGFGFTLVKTIFPVPILLLLFAQGSSSTEGNLALLAGVYIASGMVAGIIGGLLFGAAVLFWRKGSGGAVAPREIPASGPHLWRAFVLSFVFAMLIGFISGILTLGAYWFQVLPPGGALDPLTLIRSSSFPTSYPILVAWALARDMLPAMVTGLFLAPFGGGFLYRFYASRRLPKDVPRSRSMEDEF